MRKIILNSIFVGVVVLCGQSMALAASSPFVVSASVPAATSVDINPFSINSTGTPVFTPVVGLNLSFNPLTFDDTNKIYLPNHFFAIDFAPQGGAGNPDVTATYAEGANPNNPGHGLGWKSLTTFIKVTGPSGSQTETPLAGHGNTAGKKLLKDLSGENILATEFSGGFLRIYLGMVTGNPVLNEPTGAEPFTNADKGGTYDGTLTLTATLP